MAPTLTGQSSETDIDQANQWMRSQPWYQDALRQMGQDPARGIKLNDGQKKQLASVIAAHGLPLPDNDEIDPAGNVNPKGHKMRNFLIAAAIGGATVATLGAAGAFAGGAAAAGAGSAGAGAGTAAAGTAAGVGAGAAGAGAGAAGTAATLGTTAAAAKGLGALGWASLAGNVGSNIVGNVIAAKSNNKATAAEAEAAQKALDFAKERLARQDSLYAPYIESGRGALGVHDSLLGLPTGPPASGPKPAGWVPNASQGAPMSALMNVGTPSNTETVIMQAPDGSRRQVPKAFQTMAEAQGGKLLA